MKHREDPTRCYASEARDDWADREDELAAAKRELRAAIAATPPDHPDHETLMGSKLMQGGGEP